MMYAADGCQLAFTENPRSVPVLTCQLRSKWYRLYLVLPSGKVREADLSDIEDFAPSGESASGDHCWNPKALHALAEAKGWDTDDIAYDLLTGRWVNEHLRAPPSLSEMAFVHDSLTVEEKEVDTHKVHFALRLAKLQANYQSNIDEDVTNFLEHHGITDIYNVPKKWTEVQWRGKTYVLCELEDEEGIVTPFGLYLDWPAPTPDMVED